MSHFMHNISTSTTVRQKATAQQLDLLQLSHLILRLARSLQVILSEHSNECDGIKRRDARTQPFSDVCVSAKKT